MTMCNRGADKNSEASQAVIGTLPRAKGRMESFQLTGNGYVSPDSSLVDRTETRSRWGYVLDELGSWTQVEQKVGFRFLTKRPLSRSSFVVCII
jgi:hypothetical protein